mmetsp:Transcript_82897/g.161471  ORF Transcript_82897/g.161471 Transcript_82897/m.161471 type:complete len:253 (+) Transcript_82897:32-790(+)
MWALLIAGALVSSTQAFKPSHLSLARRFEHVSVITRRRVVPASTAEVHPGIKCDCCFMDPIVGVRFECANSPDVDICSVCALTPGQTFTVAAKPFSELTWRVASKSSTSSQTTSSVPIDMDSVPDGIGIEKLSQVTADILSRTASVLDVREPPEFTSGHLLIGVSIPLSTLRMGVYPESPDTGVPFELDQRFYLHAGSDGVDIRAREAAALLLGMGYAGVVPISDGVGIEDIAAAGVSTIVSGAKESFYDTC